MTDQSSHSGPEQVWIAENGTVSEKLEIAISDTLASDAAIILINAGPEAVVKTIAYNRSVSSDILAMLASHWPQLVSDLQINPNLDFLSRLSAPVGSLTGASAATFCAAVRATAEERAELEHKMTIRANKLKSLGEVWTQIRRSSLWQEPI